MAQVTLERARAAKEVARRRFEAIGKVVGIGITRVDGTYALKINLAEPVQPGTELPTEIDGVPLRIEVTGTIRAR
jgi:hypothetical protein